MVQEYLVEVLLLTLVAFVGWCTKRIMSLTTEVAVLNTRLEAIQELLTELRSRLDHH